MMTLMLVWLKLFAPLGSQGGVLGIVPVPPLLDGHLFRQLDRPPLITVLLAAGSAMAVGLSTRGPFDGTHRPDIHLWQVVQTAGLVVLAAVFPDQVAHRVWDDATGNHANEPPSVRFDSNPSDPSAATDRQTTPMHYQGPLRAANPRSNDVPPHAAVWH